MKKFVLLLFVLSLPAAMSAQDNSSVSKLAQKGILNHLDVGVNVGTLGLGVDVAVPVGDYVRIRAGYNYMPRFSLKSDFNVETNRGSIGNLIEKFGGRIDEILAEYNIKIEDLANPEYENMYEKFKNIEAKDYVSMGLRPNLHQFKFLVDVLPFKNNKHWSFTAGFFVGPPTAGDACNMKKETLLLEGINSYNDIYVDYWTNGINGAYIDDNPNDNIYDPWNDRFYQLGMAGFNLGTFADGEKAMMVPGKNNSVRATMEVSKIRPYLGLGYNTHLSRDQKWNLTVDAGVLFLCGSPKIYVDNVYKIDVSPIRFDESGKYLGGIGFDEDDFYYGDIVGRIPGTYRYGPYGELRNHVDLAEDLHNIPGKVGDMVNTISKFKVYPNASVTVSYRLF